MYVFCGTNNITQGGQTPAFTYAALTAYIAGARTFASANGITDLTIITATMLARDNPSGFEAARVQYNNMIRGNAAGADIVVNFDPTVLGCNGCADNLTYYNSDKIHPNNTGEYVVLIPMFQAVLP